MEVVFVSQDLTDAMLAASSFSLFSRRRCMLEDGVTVALCVWVWQTPLSTYALVLPKGIEDRAEEGPKVSF